MQTTFDPDKPHNALPPLKNRHNSVESSRLLKLCIEGRTALTELKHAGRRLPNQQVLINTLPLIEAQASSEIENIVTTRDALFKHSAIEDLERSDPAVRETFRYRTALRAGFDDITKRPLSPRTAVDICSHIKNADMGFRTLPGTKLADDSSGHVIYTPPDDPRRIYHLLDDLFVFIHEQTEIDPLIRMAIGHYQFEAIHPFTDGNGRTGRILNILFLIDQKVLDYPTLYMSGYINQHRSDYYRLLLSVTTESAWQEWIAFMLTAVAEAAKNACAKIAAIEEQLEITADYTRNKLPTVYSRELVEVLFAQPYCRIQNVVDAGIVARQAASLYLRQLTEIGVLQRYKVGRDLIFVNSGFLNILLDDRNRVSHLG